MNINFYYKNIELKIEGDILLRDRSVNNFNILSNISHTIFDNGF